MMQLLFRGPQVYQPRLFRANPHKIKSLPTYLLTFTYLLFRLFLTSPPESDRKDLLSELDVMKTLKPHPHVIRLLGCVTETGKKTAIRNDKRICT